jgi:hypothetical protein
MLMLDPLYDMIMDVRSKCATIDMIDVNICPVIFGVSIFSILIGHPVTRTHRTQNTDAQMKHRLLCKKRWKYCGGARVLLI